MRRILTLAVVASTVALTPVAAILCLVFSSSIGIAQDRPLTGKPVQLEWGKRMKLTDAIATKDAIELAGCPVSLSEQPSGHPKRFTITVGGLVHKDPNSRGAGAQALKWCLDQ